MYSVAVVGLGKIGLALAAQYADKGQRVIGCDINPTVVELTNRGEVPLYSEPGLAERVASAHTAGRLSATTETQKAVAQSDVVVVIVPLVVDQSGSPDFSALDLATAAIARGLRSGALVIYETTLPMGTTRGRFGPMLEQSGLRMGVDFGLAFSPERVLVGRTFHDLRTYPKVVGGITPESTDAATRFYRTVLDAEILVMPDSETAEFVKLAETTYRDVNIALANELARFADSRGVDASAAFRAANTQPYSHLHQAGVGVGGHCIPVYPRFLLAHDKHAELGLVRRARQINDGMAKYVVDAIEEHLGTLHDKRVLVLGLAYRPGQKEASFSSALLLLDVLRTRGARTFLHDPLFSETEIAGYGVEPAFLESPPPVHAVIVQTGHPEYLDLDWSRFQGLCVVVDGRNVLDAAAVKHAGAAYMGIGTGTGPRR
ncbi:MAG: nucleotide sugar dehydrogenase [Chloroflexi bacterium]|nr:nucleotide sugar dehydrogenase [Chloroflexota bacterium]MBV9895028.1 nucleotide sugar dehydrogenase [Chloroflexota bacterium]